jgi:ketosteroid isomerase-like protein
MLRSFLIAGLLWGLAACASAPSGLSPEREASETATILALLEAQDEAWNGGDIDGFMTGYWRSPELRFASGGDVTHGFDETLSRYKSRYATRAQMGTLDTSGHEIVILSKDAAIAHGSWQLTRAADAPSGLYTLVLRKIDGAWLIVSDTTTSAD